ncbi:MAG: sugar ABC transporter permease [Candidatus Humimicrobiaceae bacterium]|jgi:raffinose/stachyose/melibiose transport system permease protein|nr:sugar ABC transporter permease [Actinomycetota bacterium]MDD5600728.1 sugar ABC transporter permease [Actinomycetota bacterium]MDY0027939.1 sugar ABC transporter permease [Candidatus Humimicrobiaceae bacterium]
MVTIETLKKRKSRRFSSDRIKVFLFLIPAAVLLLVFLVIPIFQCLYYSLFNWNGMGPAEDFIGILNYKKIINDSVFIKAVLNTFAIVGLSLFVQLPLALFLAIMIGRGIKGRAFYRTVFFLPYVLSETITAVMWRILYNPDPKRGFINAVFQAFGWKMQDWLGNMNLVLFSIFIVLTWKYIGFHMLLYITGLQNIPRDVEEAALIDGVNKRQMLTYITLPLLSGTIRTSAYLSVLGSLQVYAIVWIMTKGGPVNASEVLSTYMYRFSFVRFQLGYGAAVAIVMLIISLIFSITYMSLTRRTEHVA